MDGAELINTNTIEDTNNIAIQGECNFLNANNQREKLKYVDIYHYKGEKITTITSYGISIPVSINK